MDFKKLIAGLLFLLSSSVYALDMDTRTGAINLIPVQQEGSKDIFLLTLGKSVQGRFFLFHQVIDGKHLVNGNAEFKNVSDKTIYLVYYIALKDSRGHLIASTSGDLQIGEDDNIHQYASAYMPLPLKKFPEIASYEITLYESEKPLGQE